MRRKRQTTKTTKSSWNCCFYIWDRNVWIGNDDEMDGIRLKGVTCNRLPEAKRWGGYLFASIQGPRWATRWPILSLDLKEDPQLILKEWVPWTVDTHGPPSIRKIIGDVSEGRKLSWATGLCGTQWLIRLQIWFDYSAVYDRATLQIRPILGSWLVGPIILAFILLQAVVG